MDYYIYCEAVSAEIINNDEETEKKIYSWILQQLADKEPNKKDSVSFLPSNEYNYNGVVDNLINLYLKESIIDVETLKTIVYMTSDETLKWLIDLDEFDYSKFDCDWLLCCHPDLLGKIAKNKAARSNIIRIYKDKYKTMVSRSKINDIIIKYFIVVDENMDAVLVDEK